MSDFHDAVARGYERMAKREQELIAKRDHHLAEAARHNKAADDAPYIFVWVLGILAMGYIVYVEFIQ